MSEQKETSNIESTKAEQQENEQAEGVVQQKSSVPFWAAITLLICIALLVGHVFADKYTPYTANGRIEAFVVPIVPQVSGKIIEIDITNNQFVEENQVLAKIDPTNYELAVDRAQVDLQLATQTSEVDVSSVMTAQAKVAEAKANLKNDEIKGRRIIRLSEKGAASVARADDARSRIEAGKAKLASARSELEKAKRNLGDIGRDNAKVRSALVALDSAQLDLYRTTLRAPAKGVITNLMVDVGHYAAVGAPVMTFISTRTVWIQADMRENALLNVKSGNPVEIVLDAAPGKIFNGEVISVGYGVSDNTNNNLGGLATVQPVQGWLRQPQHIPVLIQFSDDESKGYRRVGGQVNTVIYTGDHPIMNILARWWIRLISTLSHLY